MVEGSRVVMPRLADCSNGRTGVGFCEPDFASSFCALAVVGRANVTINIAPNRMRHVRGVPGTSFMDDSLKKSELDSRAEPHSRQAEENQNSPERPDTNGRSAVRPGRCRRTVLEALKYPPPHLGAPFEACNVI